MTKLYDDQYIIWMLLSPFRLSFILVGKSTFNFLSVPIFYGQRRMREGNQDFGKIRMNLGSPSESLCLNEKMEYRFHV